MRIIVFRNAAKIQILSGEYGQEGLHVAPGISFPLLSGNKKSKLWQVLIIDRACINAIKLV